MNIDSHCTITIHEFAAFEGWYWEIAVPGEIHPAERIKEFTMEDPGLGCPVKLCPIGSIHPLGKGVHVYKGGIKFEFVADMVKSSLIAQSIYKS